MTDRPILFSAPMVRALLEGRKTQHREIIKPQPEVFQLADGTECLVYLIHVEGDAVPRIALGDGRCGVITKQEVRCTVGDRLWVREAWRVRAGNYDRLPPSELPTTSHVVYEADHHVEGLDIGRLRASIHMPRWASRLTLVVTDVRVQRLHDISEADAIAEGVCQFVEELDHPGMWDGLSAEHRIGMVRASYGSCVRAYAHLWDHINGEGAWDADPFLAAYSFEVYLCNIDAMPAPTAAAAE